MINLSISTIPKNQYTGSFLSRYRADNKRGTGKRLLPSADTNCRERTEDKRYNCKKSLEELERRGFIYTMREKDAL